MSPAPLGKCTVIHSFIHSFIPLLKSPGFCWCSTCTGHLEPGPCPHQAGRQTWLTPTSLFFPSPHPCTHGHCPATCLSPPLSDQNSPLRIQRLRLGPPLRWSQRAHTVGTQESFPEWLNGRGGEGPSSPTRAPTPRLPAPRSAWIPARASHLDARRPLPAPARPLPRMHFLPPPRPFHIPAPPGRPRARPSRSLGGRRSRSAPGPSAAPR